MGPKRYVRSLQPQLYPRPSVAETSSGPDLTSRNGLVGSMQVTSREARPGQDWQVRGRGAGGQRFSLSQRRRSACSMHLITPTRRGPPAHNAVRTATTTVSAQRRQFRRGGDTRRGAGCRGAQFQERLGPDTDTSSVTGTVRRQHELVGVGHSTSHLFWYVVEASCFSSRKRRK